MVELIKQQGHSMFFDLRDSIPKFSSRPKSMLEKWVLSILKNEKNEIFLEKKCKLSFYDT
jgi:hypothetical protein